MYIKRGVVGTRALGKSKCHSDTREPRPHNRTSITIYFYVRLMVWDMFPTPNPRNGLNLSPVRQVTIVQDLWYGLSVMTCILGHVVILESGVSQSARTM